LSAVLGADIKSICGHPTPNVGKRFLLSVALLSALCALCSRTLASKIELPQISITKEYLKISVTLDTELESFADLFAACLAEGKTRVNNQ
jgi:hypothetical protein